MIVGVPAEVKPDEYRVAITPIGVRELTDRGHRVLVESGAGEGSAISDADYEAQGARMIGAAADVFAEAEMVLGVKEPQPQEIGLFRPGQIAFTYFHFAADRELTQACLEAEVTAIACPAPPSLARCAEPSAASSRATQSRRA